MMTRSKKRILALVSVLCLCFAWLMPSAVAIDPEPAEPYKDVTFNYRKPFTYTVEHYLDNAADPFDQQTVTMSADEIEVTQQPAVSTNIPEGYEFSHCDVRFPRTVKDGEVIQLCYKPTSAISYRVEHYQVSESTFFDQQLVTLPAGENQVTRQPAQSSKIPAGYEFAYCDKTFPLTVKDSDVIKLYYKPTSAISYRVEHYRVGESTFFDQQLVTLPAGENQVTRQPAQSSIIPAGYEFAYCDKTFPLTVKDSDVIKLFYEKELSNTDDSDLSFILTKQLTDSAGNRVGDGKPFGVHLYDENKNLITSVVLNANSDEVRIDGLQSGKTYYIVEETRDYYTIEGYSVFETELQGLKAVGIKVAQLPEGVSGTVRLQVNNSTSDVILIPDEITPLAPGVPDDAEIIEIEADPIPLSDVPSTGDNNVTIPAAIAGLTAFFAIGLVALRKKKVK